MRRRLSLGLIAALGLTGLVWAQDTAVPGPGFLGSFNMKPLGVEGVSALWISPDGGRVMLLSDRSFAVTGRITRGADGQITRIDLADPTPLRGRDGRELRRGQMDSEGLAVGPTGEVFLSAEGPARVFRSARLGATLQQIGRPRDFGTLPGNGSLEALAIGPDGTLYTLPETEATDQTPFPLFAYRDGRWTTIAQVPRRDAFLPVGADVGPDGRLYILFRSFSAISGFSTLLQRFTLTQTGLGPPLTLIETGPGIHGNLEGLTVWRDPKGGLTASMVSDDNGIFLQNAELVEYRLPD